MHYCTKCKKEVVIYGISLAPGVEEELELLRKQKGNLLFLIPHLLVHTIVLIVELN